MLKIKEKNTIEINGEEYKKEYKKVREVDFYNDNDNLVFFNSSDCESQHVSNKEAIEIINFMNSKESKKTVYIYKNENFETEFKIDDVELHVDLLKVHKGKYFSFSTSSVTDVEITQEEYLMLSKALNEFLKTEGDH